MIFRRADVAVLASLCVVLLSTACTDREAGPESGDPSVSGPTAPSAGRTAVTASEATATAVEGTDFEAVGHVPSTIDGRLANLVGIADDGTQILVQDSMAVDASEAEDPRGMALMAYDPKSTEVRDLARHGRAGHWVQIPSVTVSGDLVVWIETSSTSLYELPWEL